MRVGGTSIIFFPHWGGTCAFYFGLGEEHATLNRLSVFFFSRYVFYCCIVKILICLWVMSSPIYETWKFVSPKYLEMTQQMSLRLAVCTLWCVWCVGLLNFVGCVCGRRGGCVLLKCTHTCVMTHAVRSICILLKKLAVCFGDHSQSLRAVCCCIGCITTYIYLKKTLKWKEGHAFSLSELGKLKENDSSSREGQYRLSHPPPLINNEQSLRYKDVNAFEYNDSNFSHS